MAVDRPLRSPVLVVDDEAGPREALRLILEPEHDVLTASDGEHALEMIRNTRLDAVTLDLKMSGLSGTETLEQIREIDGDVGVVIVTGFGSFPTAVEAVRLGATDLVTKPFSAVEIRRTVQRAAARSRNGRAVAVLQELARELESLNRRVAAWDLEDLERAPKLPELRVVRDILRALRSRVRGLRSLGVGR